MFRPRTAKSFSRALTNLRSIKISSCLPAGTKEFESRAGGRWAYMTSSSSASSQASRRCGSAIRAGGSRARPAR